MSTRETRNAKDPTKALLMPAEDSKLPYLLVNRSGVGTGHDHDTLSCQIAGKETHRPKKCHVKVEDGEGLPIRRIEGLSAHAGQCHVVGLWGSGGNPGFSPDDQPKWGSHQRSVGAMEHPHTTPHQRDDAVWNYDTYPVSLTNLMVIPDGYDTCSLAAFKYLTRR